MDTRKYDHLQGTEKDYVMAKDREAGQSGLDHWAKHKTRICGFGSCGNILKMGATGNTICSDCFKGSRFKYDKRVG